MDSRIGNKFLKSSVTLEVVVSKNILNLVYIAKSLGLNEVSESGTKL